MACYDDGYVWHQEHTNNDIVAYQDSVSFSGYKSYDLDTYDAYTISEFHEPKFVDPYNATADYDYGYDYDAYVCSNPEINYFAYNYAEPKLLAYEPVACDTGYVSYHTQYSISNSEIDSGFNEPEFNEYDPTPYGGGYDIVSTYGKPLPPSDKTCYPRANSKPSEPRLRPIPESQPEPKTKPLPIPIVEPKPEPEHDPSPKPETMHVPVLMPPPKPVPTPVPLVEPEPEPEPEPVHALVPMPEPLESSEESENGSEREEYSYPNYGYDYPWPEYDRGNVIGVGYDYGYEKQVVQIPPCEYDSEVVDLCENIFGSWPCLARRQQMGIDNNPGITCPQNGHHNPWEDYANYFFGIGHPIASYNK